MDELQDLIDAMSTQRLRKDVMQWLPDKERHTHLCRMEPKQQKLYQSMLEDFFAKQGDLEIDTQNVLSQLMRLRQLCLDPSLLGFNAPSAKTEAILEAIEDGTYDEPVIIMSMFTSYLNLLKPLIEKLGKRVGMITGEMSNKEKNDTAQAFQQGKLDVLLCNIISAGTGFTLDKGEVIIFTDKAWNPSDNEQAEDRITPTQQDRNHKHFIVSMVCENTIDERINRILERKESLTAFVNQCKTVADIKRFFI
jgi:SNF2 family DNA or RNA helicase